MASHFQTTTKLIERMMARRAARQPQRAHYDSQGRRDTSYTSGLIIGSQTTVDCAYCIENTEVNYTPPAVGIEYPNGSYQLIPIVGGKWRP